MFLSKTLVSIWADGSPTSRLAENETKRKEDKMVSSLDKHPHNYFGKRITHSGYIPLYICADICFPPNDKFPK